MAYKILFFFFFFGVINVKEIGERLKETRESIGISIEEAAEDLKMRPTQIENIESGNMKAFKDVFYLKYFIRDYSKYLGLDYEDMVDEFNEYLFDYTSKISMDDIKKAKKHAKKEKDKKKISSPYTLERKRSFAISPIVIYVLVALVILMVVYYIFSNVQHDDFIDENVVYVVSEEATIV